MSSPGPHVMEAEFVLDFAEAFEDEVVIAHGFVEHGSPVFLTTSKASAEVPFGRLLYGSYDDRDTCWLGTLGRSAVEEIGRFRIHAGGEELHPQVVEGRGRWLHLVADGRWWRIDLRDCAAKLGV